MNTLAQNELNRLKVEKEHVLADIDQARQNAKAELQRISQQKQQAEDDYNALNEKLKEVNAAVGKRLKIAKEMEAAAESKTIIVDNLMLKANEFKARLDQEQINFASRDKDIAEKEKYLHSLGSRMTALAAKMEASENQLNDKMLSVGQQATEYAAMMAGIDNIKDSLRIRERGLEVKETRLRKIVADIKAQGFDIKEYDKI